MHRLTIAALVACLLLLASCTQPADEPRAERSADHPVQTTASGEDARAEIEAMNVLWTQHRNAGDFDALVALYAPDAIVLGPKATLRGRAAILADMQEDHEPGAVGTVTSDRVVVSESGDLAYVFGQWTSGHGYSGDYISVLARQEGGWMWVTDSYNVLQEPESE